MSKNRPNKKMKRTRSKSVTRSNHRAIAVVLARTGQTIAELAQGAAAWWKKNHGRRIKAGHVKEVITAFLRGKLHPPTWLTRFIERGIPEQQPAT